MVNPQSRQLFRDDAEVHLSTKAFHLLCTLLTRRPDVASKAELLRVVWPDSFVIEANLNVLIGEIRRSLGDDPQQPQYIRTVHGVGYAFCAEATEESGPRSSDGRATTRFWIEWKDRTFPLTAGDNVVGRHPECRIWLNETGVSRRHARIFVDGLTGRVMLEDLNSTERYCGGPAARHGATRVERWRRPADWVGRTHFPRVVGRRVARNRANPQAAHAVIKRYRPPPVGILQTWSGGSEAYSLRF